MKRTVLVASQHEKLTSHESEQTNTMDDSFSRDHPAKKIKYGDLQAEIDLLIAPLIRRLWKNGINTCSSYSGK
jgi:hypothetical protein